MKLRAVIRFACTFAIFAMAILLCRTLWDRYMNSPWTRDGRIRADVVNISADVSGIVRRVAVRDNQTVRCGELLFTVDADRYRLALAKAEARLAALRAASAMRERESLRRAELELGVVSVESRENARALADEARAQCDEAKVAVDTARLDLRRTEVRAPVDGYVTNLNVHPGDYANAGQAKLAMIDRNSYWVYGYFEETKLHLIRLGDPVEIRLLGSAPAILGHVESLARGIADHDNPTSRELLSDVNPVFNWVRLAQRVPVRVKLDRVPAGVQLAAGMTCTVIVHPGPPRRAPLAAHAAVLDDERNVL